MSKSNNSLCYALTTLTDALFNAADSFNGPTSSSASNAWYVSTGPASVGVARTSAGNSAMTNTASGYVTTNGTTDAVYHNQVLEYYPSYYDFYSLFRHWNLPTISEDTYPDFPVMNHKIAPNGSHILQFAVSGFKKEDIKISINDDMLVIAGARPKEEGEEDYKIVRRKIAQRSFSESFKLSEKQDAAEITSKLEDGILTVTIPLTKEIQKRNRTVVID